MTDARAQGNNVAALPPARNEGQRAMREVAGSLSAIAAVVGVDKGTISRWRSGDKIPNAPLRSRLLELYGIDRGAWDRGAGVSVADAQATRDRAPASASRSTLEETLDAIGQIKQLLEDDLVPSERKGLLDNLGKMLALRGRLEERAELLEARVVREHPRWQVIRRGLPDVLRRYPAAAEAVIKWLAEIEAQP